MMKSGLIACFILFPVTVFAQIWAHLADPCTNYTVSLGETTYVWVEMEVGQDTWEDTQIGYGTTTNLVDFEWSTAWHIRDGAGNNRFVTAPLLIPEALGTGTYYYAGRAKAALVDPWTYANTCQWTNGSIFQPVQTIDVVGDASGRDEDLVLRIHLNGTVTWTNADTNLTYTVEWSPGRNPWYKSWDDMTGIRSTNAIITVDAPMFLRVRKRSPLVAVERIFVPTDGTFVVSSAILDKARFYEVRIEGIYRFNVDNPNIGEFADGAYWQDVQLNWVPGLDGIGVRFNGVSFDGFRLLAEKENVTSHSYSFNMLGAGTPIAFSLYDPLNYLDNEGNLFATIYQLAP